MAYITTEEFIKHILDRGCELDDHTCPTYARCVASQTAILCLAQKLDRLQQQFDMLITKGKREST